MALAQARRLMTTAAITAGLVTAVGLAAAGSADAAAARVPITGTSPSWAVTGRSLAAPELAGPISARVYLAGRDPAGLAAYAMAVATPGNRDYGKYLTAAQARQRFGPAPGQVAAVRQWLTGAGLRVSAVSQHYVAVSGSLAAAQAAFDVRFGQFSGPGGQPALAPARDASVPAAVSRSVLTITGLDTATYRMKPQLPGPPAAYYTARPCSKYFGQRKATGKPRAYGRHVPWVLCGYTPQQLRSAYGAAATPLTGKGVTVAIVDAYASPTMPADANQYAAAVGDKPFRPGQYQQVLPAAFENERECGAAGWYPEESLDVEAVHAMAPDAKVVYVGAADCTDQSLLDALSRIVDYHLASVVSDSWDGVESGTSPALRAAYDQIFAQGAVQGIGFDFSAGDCGYENPATSCGAGDGSTRNQVNYPASSPWVTAVGGTSLAIGKSNNYRWETGWGEFGTGLNTRGTAWRPSPPGTYPGSYLYGSGGGTSTAYRQPAYQAGVVPASLARRLPDGRMSRKPMREVPDVAADADPQTGFLYGETVVLKNGKTGFQLSRIGGTSLSSPLFAGVEADAAQVTGRRTLGFANPLLYQLAGSPAFHDVTDTPLGRRVKIAVTRNDYTNPALAGGPVRTTLRTFGMDGGGTALLQATRGYDDVTGVGSPAAGFFAHFVSH
ncbi:MAG: protease pro-enzyme activation domain-containing protein [Streptosporangiaceae bacterium]|jgi:subtilase family serine protease